MNRSLSVRSALTAALALLTAVLAFRYPEACAAAAGDSLLLCGRRLLPALFPFLVVSALLVDTGAAFWLSFALRPAARAMGFRSSCSACILLIGLLGGFAPAASAAARCYRQGALTRQELERLLPVCINAAPSFVILAVGGMLGSTRLGLLLYCSQLGAGMLCGLFLRFWGGALPPLSNVQQPAPAEASLVTALSDAVQTFLRLTGIVVYCGFLSGGLSALLPPRAALPARLFLEISGGCAFAAQSGRWAAFLCCAVLSMQSFSVLLQVRALLPREVSLSLLYGMRPLHLAFACGILRAALFFLPAQDVYSSLAPRVVPLVRCPPDAAFFLFLLCCCAAVRADRALHASPESI